MERINGFYWVRFHEEDWIVSEWDSDKWLIPGSKHHYEDRDFEKINEEPLKRYNRNGAKTS